MAGAFTLYELNTETPTPIYATCVGQLVEVSEVYTGGPFLTDLLIRKAQDPPESGLPVPSAIGMRIRAGEKYSLRKGLSATQSFYPKEIILYLQAVSAPCTVICDEYGN